MNPLMNKMANAYGQTQINSSVATASPHKLISMLYEGALVAIANAKVELSKGNIPQRGAAISKAIAIINDGLSVSVDEEAGGELAHNLKALYEYMSHRLLIANLKQDEESLKEVEGLLRELKSAWDSIGPEANKTNTSNQDSPPVFSGSYGKA